ncbi:hypothetical protein M067_1586 [Bacteroides fragilis str. J-143-4]|nr:hypothetical protein M067_1586 [Bacteroides fragilis str. J-143-4]
MLFIFKVFNSIVMFKYLFFANINIKFETLKKTSIDYDLLTKKKRM